MSSIATILQALVFPAESSPSDLARTKPGPWDVWRFPLEISGGAIMHAGGHAHLFHLQANTSVGLWDLHAIPRDRVEYQDLRTFLESFESRHRTAPLRWRKASSSLILGGEAAPSGSSAQIPSNQQPVIEGTSQAGQWLTSAKSLLQRLRDPCISARELSQVVLFAEVMRFDAAETEELLPLLFHFIERHRFSSEDEMIVAVGSAIRKFAMNAPQPDFEQYADLLRPSKTETLPCDIELEFCKSVLWRLTSEPPSAPRALPNLTSRLTGIAEDYLSPRLILQKNYATIVLNSVLGTLLLQGERSAELVRKIKELDLNWFVELFFRRLQKLQQELRAKGGDAALRVLAFLDHLQSAQSSEPGVV